LPKGLPTTNNLVEVWHGASGADAKKNLSGTPSENRLEKKIDFRIFFSFFIFIKVHMEKSLSSPGKKIKLFILIDTAKNRKKRFLSLFS